MLKSLCTLQFWLGSKVCLSYSILHFTSNVIVMFNPDWVKSRIQQPFQMMDDTCLKLQYNYKSRINLHVMLS